MPDGFNVAPQEVEQHAKTLQDMVFARVSRANEAAQQVGMGGFQPYGVLGIPCWAAVSLCNQDSTEVTAQAADLGTTLGEKLKQTARTYQEVDDGVRDVMEEI
jgi:uncharacterized protein YunC (DUF1805 family)